jgi:biopolymer transport protein ExbD
MLVLLIIFMVITPTLAEGADINLPAMISIDEKAKDLDPIDIALLKSGAVLLDKVPVDAAVLPERLKVLHAADTKRKVMLKADVDVPYKRVRETFALIQSVGFHGVALRVSKREGAAGGG